MTSNFNGSKPGPIEPYSVGDTNSNVARVSDIDPYHAHTSAQSLQDVEKQWTLNDDVERASANEPSVQEADEKTSIPDTYLDRIPSVPSHAISDNETTYPEGGLAAWLVVLGSFSAMLAAFGIMNTSKPSLPRVCCTTLV